MSSTDDDIPRFRSLAERRAERKRERNRKHDNDSNSSQDSHKRRSSVHSSNSSFGSHPSSEGSIHRRQDRHSLSSSSSKKSHSSGSNRSVASSIDDRPITRRRTDNRRNSRNRSITPPSPVNSSPRYSHKSRDSTPRSARSVRSPSPHSQPVSSPRYSDDDFSANDISRNNSRHTAHDKETPQRSRSNSRESLNSRDDLSYRSEDSRLRKHSSDLNTTVSLTTKDTTKDYSLPADQPTLNNSTLNATTVTEVPTADFTPLQDSTMVRSQIDESIMEQSLSVLGTSNQQQPSTIHNGSPSQHTTTASSLPAPPLPTDDDEVIKHNKEEDYSQHGTSQHLGTTNEKTQENHSRHQQSDKDLLNFSADMRKYHETPNSSISFNNSGQTAQPQDPLEVSRKDNQSLDALIAEGSISQPPQQQVDVNMGDNVQPQPNTSNSNLSHNLMQASHTSQDNKDPSSLLPETSKTNLSNSVTAQPQTDVVMPTIQQQDAVGRAAPLQLTSVVVPQTNITNKHPDATDTDDDILLATADVPDAYNVSSSVEAEVIRSAKQHVAQVLQSASESTLHDVTHAYQAVENERQNLIAQKRQMESEKLIIQTKLEQAESEERGRKEREKQSKTELEEYRLKFEQYIKQENEKVNTQKLALQDLQAKCHIELEAKQLEIQTYASTVKHAESQLEAKKQHWERQVVAKEAQMQSREEQLKALEGKLEQQRNELKLKTEQMDMQEKNLQLQGERLKGKIQLLDERMNAISSTETALKMQWTVVDEKMKMVNDKEKHTTTLTEKTSQKELTITEESTKLRQLELQLNERQEEVIRKECEIKSSHEEAVKMKKEWEATLDTQKKIQEELNERLKNVEEMERHLQQREAQLVEQQKITFSIDEQMSSREQVVNNNLELLRKKEADVEARWELLQPIKTMLNEREMKLEEAARALQCKELQVEEKEARLLLREGLVIEKEATLTEEQKRIEIQAFTLTRKGEIMDQQIKQLHSREMEVERKEEDIGERESKMRLNEDQMNPKVHNIELRERKIVLREEKASKLLDEVERREKEMEKRRKELTTILDREREVERRSILWPDKRAGANYLQQAMLFDMKKTKGMGPKRLLNNKYTGTGLNRGGGGGGGAYNAKSGLSILQPSQHALQTQKRKECIEELEQYVSVLARKFDMIIRGQDGQNVPDISAAVDPVALQQKYDEVQCSEIDHVVNRDGELKGELAFLKKLKSSCPLSGGKSLRPGRWVTDTRPTELISKMETLEKWWKETVNLIVDKRLTDILKERNEMLESCMKILNISDIPLPHNNNGVGGVDAAQRQQFLSKVAPATVGARELHKLSQHQDFVNSKHWAASTGVLEEPSPLHPPRPSTAHAQLGRV